jgi:hypothetical protein
LCMVPPNKGCGWQTSAACVASGWPSFSRASSRPEGPSRKKDLMPALTLFFYHRGHRGTRRSKCSGVSFSVSWTQIRMRGQWSRSDRVSFPTIWGWLTVVFGALLIFSVFLRIRSRGRVISALLVSSILLFLFSFMQWASWYK